jgi:hypothetical protein
MEEEMSDRPDDDYEALEEAAEAQLERLHTRPELRALLAEVKRDLDPEEAARIENDARRGRLEVEVVRVPAQRVAVATAKVVLAQAARPLEEVARDAGLELSDFKKLDSGSPKARTQIALRVLEQIDAIHRAADKTMGGTARLERPPEVAAAIEKIRARSDGPPSGRNVTGTEILPVPEEVKKGITGTERLAVPEEARSHPRNVTGTARLDVPDEVRRREPTPAMPNPIWLGAIVAILVAVVLLALFR